MSDLRPFRAYRPRKDIADRVACLPYDVLSSEEARSLASENRFSFYHIDKPEIDLPADIDHYSPKVYEKGAENFKKFLSEGILFRDDKPCYYIYRQRMGTHFQTGLVAAASVDEYDGGLIKKHELTRPDKEDDRIRHISALNAQVGPVFLTYRAQDSIKRLINSVTLERPEYDFQSDDGISHTFWVVSDNALIEKIQGAFKDLPCLYVADGHHRSASASRLKCKRFLTVSFPHDEMQIMAYNRVVKDLNGHSEGEYLKLVDERFDRIEGDVAEPVVSKEFGMYISGKWIGLKAKIKTYDSSDPVNSLDVAILQNNLLKPVLGIADPRTDKRIDFVGGIRGTGELEKRVNGGWAVAFSCYPTSINQLMKVADAGLLMPPKSTWFEPKLRSGLFGLGLDEE